MKPDEPQLGYETTDVSPGAVVRFGVILAVVTVAVSVLLLPLFRLLREREVRRDPPPAPIARYEPGRPPPEPRLQTRPFDDYESLRAQEKVILEGYGWADPKAGIVRIPVAEAMKILARRGLPARAEQHAEAGGRP